MLSFLYKASKINTIKLQTNFNHANKQKMEKDNKYQWKTKRTKSK